MAAGLRWAVVLCGATFVAGCDLGLEESSNRYETLNIETKKLLDVLYQIKDEATAKANLAALEEAAGRVREVQQRIRDAEADRAEKKKGSGMGRITNYRQASIFQQTGDSARRRVTLIREADAKAGVIVDKAVEGIDFPAPPPEVSLPNAG
jgi:hypothetical protein